MTADNVVHEPSAEQRERWREVWGDPDTDVSIDVTGLDNFGREIDRFFLRLRQRGVIVAFAAGVGAVLYIAFQSPLHSYWSLLLIATSAGLSLFIATPTVLHPHGKARLRVRATASVVAFLWLFTSHEIERATFLSDHFQEFAQAVLIEFAVALLLLVLLEAGLRPWLDYQDKRIVQLTRDVEKWKADHTA